MAGATASTQAAARSTTPASRVTMSCLIRYLPSGRAHETEERSRLRAPPEPSLREADTRRMDPPPRAGLRSQAINRQY